MMQAQEMLKASVVERATGRVLMQVSGSVYEQLAVHIEGHPEWKLVEGWLELSPPLESMEMVRVQRNQLLNEYAWTVRADSPLSPASQVRWQTYLQALHAVTKDLTNVAEVVWPEPPLPYEYAEAM